MKLHPLLWVLIFAVATFALIMLISFLISISVAVAGRRYGDKLHSKHQKKIRDMLPGKNCGQCGCESCDAYARAVLFGAVAENACPHADEQLPEKMIAVVNEMQKLIEDPKPVKSRRKTIFEQRF